MNTFKADQGHSTYRLQRLSNLSAHQRGKQAKDAFMCKEFM